MSLLVPHTHYLGGLSFRFLTDTRSHFPRYHTPQGEAIWDMGRKFPGSEPDGLIVVIRGVVRMMADHDGIQVPYYLGAGGVGGLVSAGGVGAAWEDW